MIRTCTVILCTVCPNSEFSHSIFNITEIHFNDILKTIFRNKIFTIQRAINEVQLKIKFAFFPCAYFRCINF